METKYKRPDVLDGYTLKLPTPCGSFYLTMNEDEEKLREVRMSIGKAGNCQRLLFETIALLVSVLLQENISREKIKKTLLNQFESSCGNKIFYKGDEFRSCIDYAVTKILEDMTGRGEIDEP